MSDEPLDIFHDRACHLCSVAADIWRQGDRRGRLRLRPLQEPLPDDAPGPGRLEAAIHVRGRSGWQSGARALLAIYRRLPGGSAAACLLRIGIALGVADRIYRLPARHRAHLQVRLHPRTRRS